MVNHEFSSCASRSRCRSWRSSWRWWGGGWCTWRRRASLASSVATTIELLKQVLQIQLFVWLRKILPLPFSNSKFELITRKWVFICWLPQKLMRTNSQSNKRNNFNIKEVFKQRQRQRVFELFLVSGWNIVEIYADISDNILFTGSTDSTC